MKTKSILFGAFVVLFMSACKKDAKASEEVNKAPVQEYFSVEMKVIAQTMDDFTVYYTEDHTNNFIGGQAVWKGVKGGGLEETVVIDLPEQLVPTNIRLDFGIKKERKDVTLENLTIKYYGKSLNIKGSDFFNYFIKDAKMPYKTDAQKGTVTFITDVNNQNGTYYYPRQELLDEIAKMTK